MFLVLCVLTFFEDNVRFPTRPAPTIPTDVMKADEWFVVEVDAQDPEQKPPFLVTLPAGYLSHRVYKNKSSVILLGKFAGGGGKIEEREFSGDHVYVFKAEQAGDVALLLIPYAMTDESQMQRYTVRVEMGEGPKPPPPEPKPDPPKPKPKPVGPVAIQILDDPMNRSLETCQVLEELVYSSYDYRLFTMKNIEPEAKELIAKAKQSNTFPYLILRDKSSNEILYSGPLPKTYTELQQVVDGFTELEAVMGEIFNGQ